MPELVWKLEVVLDLSMSKSFQIQFCLLILWLTRVKIQNIKLIVVHIPAAANRPMHEIKNVAPLWSCPSSSSTMAGKWIYGISCTNHEKKSLKIYTKRFDKEKLT